MTLSESFPIVTRDQLDGSGEVDPDTGGSIAFLTPRVVVTLVEGLALRLAAQTPVVDNLNGFQEEETVCGVGFTYLVPLRSVTAAS